MSFLLVILRTCPWPRDRARRAVQLGRRRPSCAPLRRLSVALLLIKENWNWEIMRSSSLTENRRFVLDYLGAHTDSLHGWGAGFGRRVVRGRGQPIKSWSYMEYILRKERGSGYPPPPPEFVLNLNTKWQLIPVPHTKFQFWHCWKTKASLFL